MGETKSAELWTHHPVQVFYLFYPLRFYRKKKLFKKGSAAK